MATKETTVVVVAVKVDAIALIPIVKVPTDPKLSAAIVASIGIIGLNANNVSPTKASLVTKRTISSVVAKMTIIPRLGLHVTGP